MLICFGVFRVGFYVWAWVSVGWRVLLSDSCDVFHSGSGLLVCSIQSVVCSIQGVLCSIQYVYVGQSEVVDVEYMGLW